MNTYPMLDTVRILLLLFSMVASRSLSAQFNSKVGYAGAHADLDVVNAYFVQFDNSNTWLDKRFEGINIVHGLELGARYKIYSTAFEFGILTAGGGTSAVGVSPVSQSREELKWKASLFDYHFSIAQQFGSWGIGFGVSNQRLTMKELNLVSREFVEITKEKQWAGKVFLNIEIPSNTVSLALRPFYQMSFDGYNVEQVATQLAADTSNQVQNVNMIGLSVLFFNGPQY